MGRRERAKVEEVGGPEIGLWVVTFSDCMTNMLTFFLLLLTFSSFEETSYNQFKGAFRYEGSASIFPGAMEVPSSSIEPAPREADRTEEGSDAATTAEPRE